MQNINTQIKRKFKKPNSIFLNSYNRKELITKFQIENNYIKYIKNESCKIYTIYENDFYKIKKKLEINIPKNNILLIHKISSFLRSKLIDWMIEVFNAYSSEKQTFFISVQILDLYIYQTKKILTDLDLHLIGITCILIASQFEDLFPIQMNELINKIGYKLFTKNEIINKEIEIISTIGFSLFNSTTYDFILIYIFDFYYCNKEKIEKLNMENYLNSIENTSIFLAKMLCLNDKFSIIFPSIKAICCITGAFDSLQSNCILSFEVIEFLKGWIVLLIEKNNIELNCIESVYNDMKNYYIEMNCDLYLGKNLKLTHSLYF